MSAKNKRLKAAAKASALGATQYQYSQSIYGDLEVKIMRHECGKFLMKRFRELVDRIDDPYTDNFRWAEVGDPFSESLYAKARDKGCCGFADEVVVDPKTGRSFRIGFNYGH